MNGTWTAIAISTCILACIGVCVILYLLGYKDGWDAHADHMRDRDARRTLARTPAQEGIRSKVTYGGADGAPPWYVMVEPRRSRVAVPGITMASLAPTTPISPRRATDTGELRSLAAGADLYVDRITADGDAYRAEMTA